MWISKLSQPKVRIVVDPRAQSPSTGTWRLLWASELRRVTYVSAQTPGSRCNTFGQKVADGQMSLATIGRPNRAESERRLRVAQSRASGKVARRKTLPPYLEPEKVRALMEAAPHADAQLVMLIQWRAGLRISEALGLEVADLHLDADPPTLKVRWDTAKRSKERLVPVHPELAGGLSNHLRYRRISVGRLITVERSTAWRWLKTALRKAKQSGAITEGRNFGTHALRHSAARHWLACGVPINQVSMWLGHASIQTTLVYLQLLPDPSNWMERVS